MDTTAEPPLEPLEPKEPPAEPSRRTRWLLAGGAVLGIVVLAALSKNGVKLSGLAQFGGPDAMSGNSSNHTNRARSGSRRPLDHRIDVPAYPRQQAYGPNYSLRKPVMVAPHSRGPEMAT